MAKPTPSKSSKPTTSSKKKTTEQETFEKELQNLKAKAQEETYGKYILEQSSVFTLSAVLLALAATYSTVSQLTLSPVYGSIPSSVYHDKVVLSALFLGWSLNLYLRRLSPVKPIYLLPVIATYIPAIQFFLFQCGDFFGGKWGPVITEGLTIFPLILVSASCVASTLDNLDLTHGRRFTWFSNAMPGISSFVFFKLSEYYSSNLISASIGQTVLHTRLGLQACLATSYSIFQPSKLLLFALPAVLHTALFNTHVQLPYQTNALNTTMLSKGWSILERKDSLTGYLSIVESSERGFRVMRCDHSLLGGEWLTATTKTNHTEPIYGIFVMLEAIRLIEVPNPVPDNEAKALVVYALLLQFPRDLLLLYIKYMRLIFKKNRGLGIGTTPLALHTHGINTTIVEIDPVVHEFAVKYFSFPAEINAKLVDAISYASTLVQEGVEKFDYIVHDVFTGGAEPVELFTVEFIGDLKSLLKPNGVVAIVRFLLLPNPHSSSPAILLRTNTYHT